MSAPAPVPTTPPVTAEALLRDARARRATFPDEHFHGFTATVTFHEGNQTFSGQLVLKNVRDLALDLPGVSLESQSWLKDVLAMNIAHRLERTGGMPVPTNYPVSIAEAEENPLGVKIVFEGDPLGSSYRIRDGVITEVNRQMHGSRFTITTLEVVTGDDGRLMPKHYVVTYFDPETGRLTGVAQYTELYEKVGAMYLPSYIRVIETKPGEASLGSSLVRVVELTDLALLAAETP
ncbi:MAG: DUF3386 family protein [Chloracidobacterium sp.]|uniref:DUF3386 family protein n=1 Tax=Chloracidobacterium validum TaxID=2821543 RepID=A0ABX8BAL2_9BACT|nr:DUF3386 family protein [Chloracidobacterium validum]QUW02100.1 DUF3386 family protein [Chloracidobacterium validum]